MMVFVHNLTARDGLKEGMRVEDLYADLNGVVSEMLADDDEEANILGQAVGDLLDIGFVSEFVE